jgi:hypothetical protein
MACSEVFYKHYLIDKIQYNYTENFILIYLDATRTLYSLLGW